MIRRLKLTNFKNFQAAELALGAFTLLIGVNATGKSNLREAFRFLHGITRGYSLADILGGKYVGGALQWDGIRGGLNEIAFRESTHFGIEVDFDLPKDKDARLGTYRIEIDLAKFESHVNQETSSQQPVVSSIKPIGPLVSQEILNIGNQAIFRAYCDSQISQRMHVELAGKGASSQQLHQPVSATQPVITQLEEILRAQNGKAMQKILQPVRETISAFSAMRFLSLEPEAMRIPSLPGQTILGDRGENLSTALQAIVEDSNRRLALMEWIKELTPMDAADFKFPIYADGKTLMTLIEKNGQAVSAYSASDGTLRFLAIMATMLGPKASDFYFFEELENGIHPTRLHLLAEMIEQEAALRQIQIVATTHSPQLLRVISPKSLQSSSLVYRLEGQPSAQLKRIMDLPQGARQVIEKKDVARLYESGWFENAMSLLEEESEA